MKQFPKLAELAEQTDPLVAKRMLLESLDLVIATCANLQRMTNGGDMYDMPDNGTIIKALELAGRVTGVIGVDPAVLIQFKSDTEKLVSRAKAVLLERETKPSVLAKGESKR